MDGIEEITYSDDLMPNEGGLFHAAPDPELQDELNRERTMITGAIPLLDEILETLDAAIKEADSIRLLKTESRVSLEGQIVGTQQFSNLVEGLKSNIEAMRDTYTKKKPD